MSSGKKDPETLHGDAELDALANAEQTIAARVAMLAVRALRARGYDFVIVRICKIVSRDGEECAAPGATAFECHKAMLPGLPSEASGLRLLADDLDAAFRKGGTHEAESGYNENATDRMAEFGVDD